MAFYGEYPLFLTTIHANGLVFPTHSTNQAYRFHMQSPPVINIPFLYASSQYIVIPPYSKKTV